MLQEEAMEITMGKGKLSRWIISSAFLSFGFGLQAGNLIIGEPPLTATGNCDPFGCPAFFDLGTYQQVYTDAAFSGESTITALTFYDSEIQNNAVPATGTYTLSLSYSNNGPGELNLINPNNNITSGSQVFFTGSVPQLSQNMLVFGGTAFDYNPADGNLLLTITMVDPSDLVPTLFLDQSAMTNQTTNAFFGSFNGGNNTGGLVTGFTMLPSAVSTPEPGSLFFILGGVSLIAYLRRRQRLS
jgi:hypothetical protein